MRRGGAPGRRDIYREKRVPLDDALDLGCRADDNGDTKAEGVLDRPGDVGRCGRRGSLGREESIAALQYCRDIGVMLAQRCAELAPGQAVLAADVDGTEEGNVARHTVARPD